MKKTIPMLGALVGAALALLAAQGAQAQAWPSKPIKFVVGYAAGSATDGTTRFSLSAHEMGQGIRTVIAAVLLRELDIDPDRLELVIGDTSATPQHQTAGSWGTGVATAGLQGLARRSAQGFAGLLTRTRRTGGRGNALAGLVGVDRLEIAVGNRVFVFPAEETLFNQHIDGRRSRIGKLSLEQANGTRVLVAAENELLLLLDPGQRGPLRHQGPQQNRHHAHANEQGRQCIASLTR